MALGKKAPVYKKAVPKKETFMKFFNRTCDKTYRHAFEYSFNHDDAIIVTQNAYVYMYNHLSDLRKSASVEAWQRKCIDASFRETMRSKRLSLIHEKEAGEEPEPLSEYQRENIWSKINKLGSIDPWRLVPIPGKSSIFSVVKDRYVSDLSMMSLSEILKLAAAALAIIGVLGGGVYLAVRAINDDSAVSVLTTEEIFIDESKYLLSSAPDVSVDQAEIDRLTSEAERVASRAAYESRLASEREMSSVAKAEYVAVSSEPLLYYELFLSSQEPVYTPPEEIKMTAGEPKPTNDPIADAWINALIESVPKGEESEAEYLYSIYKAVGAKFKYAHTDFESKTEIDMIKYFIQTGEGDSRHYSAVLGAVYRMLGYDCTTVSGSFVMNRGTSYEKYVEHWWNSIMLNGTRYYLDLEADSNADGSIVRNYYFLATQGNPLWEVYKRDHHEGG
ncbi:MAG: transglutaminase-like domain-containing protein [Oscillospiraceae bacterium]|jgi:hypothetical protein|nr:transglutaminase-like domain-containing protein [Oscillospiraceae bacterium]